MPMLSISWCERNSCNRSETARAATIQIQVATGDYDVSISLTNPAGTTTATRQHTGGLLLTPKTVANMRPPIRATVQKIQDEMGLL